MKTRAGAADKPDALSKFRRSTDSPDRLAIDASNGPSLPLSAEASDTCIRQRGGSDPTIAECKSQSFPWVELGDDIAARSVTS